MIVAYKFGIHFNSRPHGGRRRRNSFYEFRTQISTHALTEGDARQDSHCPIQVFQLTPSRRATETLVGKALADVFQLTPSRRATFSAGLFAALFIISTHALTEGDVFRGF